MKCGSKIYGFRFIVTEQYFHHCGFASLAHLWSDC
jgi:hypothetical protein